jgi:light-regulated signal transduction histidine kinase (bacteriophytochrome)
MPHGHCFFWRPEILWLHVSSDTLIVISYYLIPFALVYLVRKRRDLAFDWMFLMFGLFILACGTTHLMAIWNLWHSAYRLEGVVKAITAVVSLPTALLLFRLLPTAVALPSPEQLRAEIQQRTKAEEEVRRLNAELEQRVEERTEKLQRANDTLKRYAYVASHDLQEPLRMVVCYNQLLAERYKGQLDTDADEFIGYSVEGSTRMQELITDLLAYGRSLEEPSKGVIEDVDLGEELQRALANLKFTIQRTNARITSRPMPVVRAERAEIRQVFQNLIGNALKYSRPGEPPDVEIWAETRDGAFVVSVRDHGVGIPPEYQSKIFEPFKRLHGRQVPGSGVGLTICKNIVEARGGRIWVESEAGAGATFSFTLPLKAAEAVEV